MILQPPNFDTSNCGETDQPTFYVWGPLLSFQTSDWASGFRAVNGSDLSWIHMGLALELMRILRSEFAFEPGRGPEN